jgi:hypothetical protein
MKKFQHEEPKFLHKQCLFKHHFPSLFSETNYEYYQWMTVLWSGNYLHLWHLNFISLHTSQPLDPILSQKSVWGPMYHFTTYWGIFSVVRGLLASHKTPSLEDYPFISCPHCLFRIFTLPSNHNLRTFDVNIVASFLRQGNTKTVI